ncbi:MAG: ATP-dependent helicase [Anaerovoracaceae bacterium]
MNLDYLNKEQQKAATHTEGPLLILAGAGSGKTATMTHRIAYLIEQGVSPYSILAVTFTNKAAKEMRDRVEKLVGPCPGMWIMTFHAMSLRILREHYYAAGYDKNFVVYDTVDQKTIIKNIIKEQNIDSKQFPQAYLSAIISKEKEADSDPEQFLENSDGSPKAKVIYNVYKEYQHQLRANNAMDFDDLLLNALHVLRDNPDILVQYQNRFRYIMVDEYQDTNHIQYQIIRMMAMAHQNLCVVGDDDQCIYQWRGADIRNILDFEKDFPAAKVIKLEQNYRSCGNILAAAHSVIKNNRGRKPKKLWTEADAGAPIVYKRCDSDKEEAYYVAQEIDLLSGSKDCSYNDFAVLYRTNAQSRLFEDALKRRHIPYQILSGFSFYERKETKDMICYMRLVVNPADDLALKRIINEPKRGIGPTTLGKLEALARVNGQSLFDTLSQEEVIYSLPAKASVSVKAMMDVMQLCQQEKDNLRVSDIYDNLLVKTGYLKALEDENTVESESRIENLLDFKSFIYDYEKEKADSDEKATLEEFLERVATDSDTDKYDDESGKVTLMTMHSAKGLEFPVVFMPGMEDGLFPGHRALDSENGIEEERRLCYVGMTRAKEKLFLTSAAYRVLYGHGDYTRESIFLRELDKSLLDEAGDSIYEPSRRTNNRLGVDTGSLDGYSENPPFRPYGFDPLKYARQSVKESAAANTENFMQGDQVTHGKFGHGIVVDVDAKTVTVAFDEGGTKKLAKGIAPLRKV